MMAPWGLIRRDSGQPVVDSLEVADGLWSRFRGLQLRAGLPLGRGLLLVPCPSVHTFFMRFAIDVVLLNRQAQVVAVRRHVRPWRMVLPVPGSYATLEVPAGTTDVEPGDALCLIGLDGVRPPWSLRFLSSTAKEG
jgi:hypothetical protein